MEQTSRMFESRSKSEMEAASAQPIHNRLHAMALSELLDKRKSAKTREDVVRLAKEYGIDVGKLESLTRFVSSPSVEGGSAVRIVDKEGNESLTMKVCIFLVLFRWPRLMNRLHEQ
jgi:crotonobetainyl-CoA:carnitine CoA-transferase CaiB-like acyl-CoA transferase